MPVVGNFIEFGKNPVDFIARCLEKYGAIYTVPMLHKNLTFLLGPEVSAPFFRLNDDFMSQPEVYGFMTPVFGKGVVYDAEPKKRTQQYQSMAQGLRAQRLKAYVPKIEMETLAYLKEKWGASGTVNILDALSELTILTSSRCLHGDDVRENLFGEVARIYHDLDKGVTPLSFFFPYAPTEAHRLRDAARKEMVAIFSKVINARKEKGVDSTEATDILQIFIDMEYKDGTKLTADEIVGLLIALLFAGQHTSSITSTWTAMFLAHNPRCLAEVLKEQQEVLGDNNKDVPLNFDTVGKMEYLQNCVKESLRMYPPLIMLMRMAMQDITTTLNGKEYIIPKVSRATTTAKRVWLHTTSVSRPPLFPSRCDRATSSSRRLPWPRAWTPSSRAPTSSNRSASTRTARRPRCRTRTWGSAAACTRAWGSSSACCK
jgi:sterol 14-demethylase